MPSNVGPRYIPAQNRAKQESDIKLAKLSPWGIQQAVVERLRDYFINTDSKVEFGFPSTYPYAYPTGESIVIDMFAPTGEDGSIVNDMTKSELLISSAFEVNQNEAGKRPAIIVYRGGVTFKYLGFGHSTLDSKPEESMKTKVFECSFPLRIAITTPVIGVAEWLAEFIQIQFLSEGEQLADEICLSSFKVVELSAPTPEKENKLDYTVNINCEVTYFKAYTVIGDDLKIHNIVVKIMDLEKPLRDVMKNQ